MKFFTYNQNNSGGKFTFEEGRGITHFVIVEATDHEDADSRAVRIGLYLHGCISGRDCSCCGDRWSNAWSDDGTDAPEVYGKHPREHEDSFNKRFAPGKSSCIHYADGRKEWF